MDVPSGKPSTDVLVVGGGVIGLSVAVAASRANLTVRVIDARLAGAASAVAAGLLAPSLGSLAKEASEAFHRAAAAYPQFLSSLPLSVGHRRPSVASGILEIALPPEEAASLNEADDRSAVPLSPEDVGRLAIDLSPTSGGMLHPNDGWIDPAFLIGSLGAALPSGAITVDRVRGIDVGRAGVTVRLDTGASIQCGHVVVAAGSWSPLIEGLATRLPITPARGEVLVLQTAHTLPHAIACDDHYLVPRAGEIVVGATFELVGYDARTTDRAKASMESFADRIIPGPFRRATSKRTWAGLRPMTPDKLPIIDTDPTDPRIVYACGHGKNGLLLAGLTAELVVDLIAGNRQDRAFPFRLDRFDSG